MCVKSSKGGSKKIKFVHTLYMGGPFPDMSARGSQFSMQWL